MAQIGSRRGAVPSTTPILMILAFVAMAGFLYWLSVAADGSTVEVEEDGAAADTAYAGPAAEEMTVTQFRGDPSTYVGRRVRITGVGVSGTLGRGGRLFWLQPDNDPYLVHRDSAMAAEGRPVRSGLRGHVVGTVHEMSDSALDAWEAGGVFEEESDRFVAEFADTYLEAEWLRLEEAAGQGG